MKGYGLSSYREVFLVLITSSIYSASCQLSASPVLSEVSQTVTFSWEIPQGGLTSGAAFFAVKGSTTVFILTSTDVFSATTPYRNRTTFLGSYSSRNVTFTLTNIQTSDAGDYICGNGGANSVIANCGQKLIVIGRPSTPAAPAASTAAPVYNREVTLTCTSTSTTVPADHGLTMTYMWQRDESDVTGESGSSYIFTVSSRDTHDYRCRARESQGLKSDVWSPVYTLVPNYGPYQITLTPTTTSYTVTEGQDTISDITCSAICNPSCSYRWLKNGANINNNVAILSLGQAARSQTGSYQCQLYNTHGNSVSSTVSVDVQYPAEVSIVTPGSSSCRPYKVYVGQQNVQLTCQVRAANPGVTSFRWKQNSSVISSATSSEFTISSVSTTNEGSYTRQGNNGILTPADSQAVALEVQYGPTVSVSPSNQTVTEGDTITWTCSVNSKPLVSEIWTRKDGGSFTPPAGSTLTISNIQRSQTGTYVCTTTNNLSPCVGGTIQRSDSEEVSVDVQFKASITNFTINLASGSVTVSEGDTVTLTCEVNSNPRSSIALLYGSEEIKNGGQDNSLTASRSVGCRQRGNYSCAASNIIGAAVNTVVKLAVTCSPRADDTFTFKDQYASSLGGNVTVSVPVLAYLTPTFTWSRTSSTSQELTGSFIPVSDISVTVILELTHLQQQDFGEYNLTVENGQGEPALFTVKIVPEGPPEIPTNVTVAPDSPNTLVVSWKQGFNNGAPQNFTVEYSKDNVTWNVAGTYQETGEALGDQQQTVPNLDASTSYSVRIIARNKNGASRYTGIVTGLTEKEPIIESSSESNVGVINLVGATIGCILAILIIVGLAVFMMRKGFRCVLLTPDTEVVTKRARTQETSSSATDSRVTYVNQNQNPYSDLNREGDKQTYTELKTYVNIEPRSPQDASATNVYDSLQDKTPVSYETVNMHTYENTGTNQNVLPYENVETRTT